METKRCENCEHQYVNHKKCDLPLGAKCNGGKMWEKRKDMLNISPASIPDVCVGCINAEYKNEWVEPCHSCSDGNNKIIEL